MKRGEFIFERSLMAITFVFVVLSLINDSFVFALLPWLWMLGIGQLWRSFDIAKRYWKNRKIRSAIMIYWVTAGAALATFFSEWTLLNESPGYLSRYVIYLPICIAAYWSFVCWYFREKKETTKQFSVTHSLKRGNALFEHILFRLTVLLGIGLYFNDDLTDTLIVGFNWLVVLTILQSIHSFLIANTYWENPKIRLALLLYWIAGGLHVVLPAITNRSFIDEESVWILGIPFVLAAYLWCINWFFQEKVVRPK
jgi:hypothetical protein